MVALKLAIPASIQRSFACRLRACFPARPVKKRPDKRKQQGEFVGYSHESGFLAKTVRLEAR